MLDQTVTFEDVSAETIAMEFVQFEDVDADTLAMEHFDDMKTELCMDSVWSIWEAAALSADDLLFQDRQYRVVYNHVRHDATTEEIWADVKDGGNRADAQVSMFAPSGSFKHLWFAADSCIKQSGTYHSYIEDFQMQEDGSLLLITGS